MHFSNDTDLYRVIGANIKYYREQANLTQVQLAEQAKISTSYLSKIEAAGCNKSLSISVLNQIANVLGVEINEFFNEGGIAYVKNPKYPWWRSPHKQKRLAL